MEFVKQNRTAIIAIVAATMCGLGSGTNYAFSAWSPQFAERMKLTALQSNFLSTAANIGMNLFGLPLGYCVDRFGPRIPMFAGAFSVGMGYLFLYSAYTSGPRVYGPALCSFFALLTGLGGSSAFAAAMKAAALSWPNNRGTATSIPLAAFGLSALIFTGVSDLVATGSTAGMLSVLTLGSFFLIFSSSCFLPNKTDLVALNYAPLRQAYTPLGPHTPIATSLLSRRSSANYSTLHTSGISLLKQADFWILFSLQATLSGIGIMTIYNIGHDVQATWIHYDHTAKTAFILGKQMFHVSIISAFSFGGRLLSGSGSDYLNKNGYSRLWCLMVSTVILGAAQVLAYKVSDPRNMFLVSTTTGLGYGFLYGSFPVIVSDIFGVEGLSQNWGLITVGSIVGGTLSNLLYGRVYDSNSVLEYAEKKVGAQHGIGGGVADMAPKEPLLTCTLGNRCYQEAYLWTACACVFAAILTLLSVQRERARKELYGSKGDA